MNYKPKEASEFERMHRVSELNKMRMKLARMHEYGKISETSFNECDSVLAGEIEDIFDECDTV